MANKYLEKALKRDDLINKIIENMNTVVSSAQQALLLSIIEDVVDQLETKDGFILNNSKNKRYLLNIDRVFTNFANGSGLEVIKTIIDATQSILNFNTSYFRMSNSEIKIKPISIKVMDNINSWLGITKDGAIGANGYLDTLLKDASIKNEVRNQLAQAVISQQGHTAARKGMIEFVGGKKEQTGKFEQYMRNTVYDTFSQVDRAAAQVFADDLGLEYAIYAGGIIKTTRPFCRERDGKVFSRPEILLFNPPTAKPPNYNPITDLGGYGCRHHLNWIPEAVAFALRPELKDLKIKRLT